MALNAGKWDGSLLPSSFRLPSSSVPPFRWLSMAKPHSSFPALPAANPPSSSHGHTNFKSVHPPQRREKGKELEKESAVKKSNDRRRSSCSRRRRRLQFSTGCWSSCRVSERNQKDSILLFREFQHFNLKDTSFESQIVPRSYCRTFGFFRI